MVAWAVAVFEALRLVEGEVGAEQLVDAHGVAVEVPGAAQRELHAVAGEPDRVPCRDLVDGGLPEHVERHVHEFHVAGLGHVRGEADAVALVERTARHRHVAQRDQIVHVDRHVFAVELHRRDAEVADLLAFVLAALRGVIGFLRVLRVALLIVLLRVVVHAGEEIETFRRLAERDRADAVHGRHVVVLDRTQLFHRRALGMTVAQVGGEFTQLGVQVLLERVGILGVRGLRVCGFRHQAVLVHQRGEHLPPAAVIGRTIVDLLEDTAVGRLVDGGQHVLQIRVRLLQCIPEEQVGFGEFEIVEVPAVHHLVAQRVERGEHPATAGAALVRDRPLLEFDGEVARQRARALVVGGGGQYAG